MASQKYCELSKQKHREKGFHPGQGLGTCRVPHTCALQGERQGHYGETCGGIMAEFQM